MQLDENKESDVLDGEQGEEGLLDNPLMQALLDPEKPAADKEDDDESTEGLSVEVLQDRLKARNLSLRKREKAIERMQEEIKELQSRNGLTPELLNALVNRNQNPPAQEADEEASLIEQLGEENAPVVKMLLQRERAMEAKIVQVLRQRDAAIAQQTREKPSAEIAKAVAKLKELPAYKGFNDEQLETVAKTFIPVAKAAGRPPSPMSGGRKVTAQSSEKDVLAAYKDELLQMGYTS